MNRLKLLLSVFVVFVSTVLAAAKFLLAEVHDFWELLKHLQW
jgi:hypothetical protein